MRRPSRWAALAIIATGLAMAQTPLDKEQALGSQLVAEASAPFSAITTPEVTTYIGRLIAKLKPPEGLRVPLQLRIVSSSEPMASMFPGGYLLLSSGAILRAQSEAELAALLAHEMGHLQEGPLLSASPGSATIPLVFVGAENRGGLKKILPVALAGRIQFAEAQADGFALDALDRAGYDERALISAFRGWDTQVPVDDAIRTRAEASTGIVVVDSSEFQLHGTARVGQSRFCWPAGSPPRTSREPMSVYYFLVSEGQKGKFGLKPFVR